MSCGIQRRRGGFKLDGMQLDALLIVAWPDIKPVMLSQNIDLSRLASEDNRLAPAIASGNRHELQGWQIVRRSSTAYAGERVIHDCLAVRGRGWGGEIAAECELVHC